MTGRPGAALGWHSSSDGRLCRAAARGYGQIRSWETWPLWPNASQDPNHAHRAKVSLVVPSGRVSGFKGNRMDQWTILYWIDSGRTQ
jgi:hypothetical protein